jgi:hypothetical protein
MKVSIVLIKKGRFVLVGRNRGSEEETPNCVMKTIRVLTEAAAADNPTARTE